MQDFSKRDSHRNQNSVGRGTRFENASCANSLIPLADQLKIAKWKKDPKDFLIYLGCPGCGKTHFCHALMNDLKPSPQLLYRRLWNESQFISKVKMSFDMQGTFEQAVEELSDDDLVIFDDLGSTMPSDWKRDVILKFVDIRHATRLPTVVTSNLTPDEIYERFGKRVHSRLFDSRNIILDYGEIDLRKTDLDEKIECKKELVKPKRLSDDSKAPTIDSEASMGGSKDIAIRIATMHPRLFETGVIRECPDRLEFTGKYGVVGQIYFSDPDFKKQVITWLRKEGMNTQGI